MADPTKTPGPQVVLFAYPTAPAGQDDAVRWCNDFVKQHRIYVREVNALFSKMQQRIQALEDAEATE